MNEFENQLIIKEETYQRSFFPTIPNFHKRGSAFILTGGIGNDIVVDEYTTTKEIRQGKYSRLVEISIRPYMKELRFHSPSKENAYSFDIYVKAVIQVEDPILFYQNKNIDVDAYFNKVFSLDVRKITKGYSVLDYDGMDEELTQTLSSINTIDEATGFSYQISAVDAVPGQKAQPYVERNNRQQIEADLKSRARKLASAYSVIYEEAVRTEVVEGKLSETDAILKINEYRNMSFDNQISRLQELKEKGLLTDKEARKFVAPTLEEVGITKQEGNLLEENNIKEMDRFYIEEEK